MNILNIAIGNTYKNYKQLCEVLEVNTKTGNAKKAQLKDFERYFKYDKKGHSFIITHVYDIPLPENNNKTKYIPTIEKLILDKVVEFGNRGQLFISKNGLLKELQMINENYAFAKYKQLRLAKHMDITLEEIEDFYLTSDDMLKRNIEAALNSLRNQSLVFWSHAITLCFIDTCIQKNNSNHIKVTKEERTNEFGEEIVTFETVKPVAYRTYRKATKEEIELILRVEKETMEQLNCESIQDVIKRGHGNKFYKTVKDELFKLANIYFYYNSYEIIANEDYIYSKWEELEDLSLELDEKEKALNQLNNDIVERISINTERRHNKAIESLDFDNKKVKMRSDERYKENANRLTDTLINNNAISIKEALNSLKIN